MTHQIFKTNLIKRKCKKCGDLETYSIFGVIFSLLNILFVVLGLIFVVCLFFMGSSFFTDPYLNFEFTHFAKQHTDELRAIALNYTTYDGPDSFEFAKDLATNMDRVRYVHSSKFKQMYDPLTVLEQGGDCKNSAILFVGMMLSCGHNAYVKCSEEHRHCVSYIPHIKNGQRQKEYMIVDLTGDEIMIYDNNVSFWDNPLLYKEGIQIERGQGFIPWITTY